MNMSSKKLTYILAIVLVALFNVTSFAMTIAYLIADDSISNNFILGNVESEVVETFDGTTKENVYINNTGNVPIYVRADILIYFEDENGIILPETPVVGSDYTLSLGNNWKKINDRYYYQDILDINQSSSNLINSCTNLSDKKLVVEVLTQAIQANTTDALQDAWGLSTIYGTNN